ncbi:MAG: ROK family protein [Lachnospiraceae bacterium]|nr:ROK family protein [Lachnospiraceae bacterium]
MNYRIGVDIGGMSIKVGVVDENYNIIARHNVVTPDTFEKSMKATADAVMEVIGKLGLSINDFPCVGIGTPGSVVPETGRLCFSNNTNWKDVPMADELKKYIPIPVFIANDANCAIIGETVAGAAKGRKHVIMLTLGTGVGGGIVINGKVFSGGNGVGAELGHMVLIHDGYPCTCGMNGCLESYASATALMRQTREAIEVHPESAMNAWVLENGEVNGKTAFECAKAGDETAMQVVDTYVGYLANGIGSLINIFRPEVVLIGGGVSNAGDFFLNKIRERMPEYTFAYDITGPTPIERATLGNDAGIIGASYLDEM